jgi:AcrR family transcriptional regulator
MPKGKDNSTLIIDAASRLFLEHGYAATSMDVVAQQAGVSKATVYALFESKDNLFAAMIEREGHKQLVALEADAVAPVGTVLRRHQRCDAATQPIKCCVVTNRCQRSEPVSRDRPALLRQRSGEADWPAGRLHGSGDAAR